MPQVIIENQLLEIVNLIKTAHFYLKVSQAHQMQYIFSYYVWYLKICSIVLWICLIVDM